MLEYLIGFQPKAKPRLYMRNGVFLSIAYPLLGLSD